jgi:hypothetical protein
MKADLFLNDIRTCLGEIQNVLLSVSGEGEGNGWADQEAIAPIILADQKNGKDLGPCSQKEDSWARSCEGRLPEEMDCYIPSLLPFVRYQVKDLVVSETPKGSFHRFGPRFRGDGGLPNSFRIVSHLPRDPWVAGVFLKYAEGISLCSQTAPEDKEVVQMRAQSDYTLSSGEGSIQMFLPIDGDAID